MAGLPVENPTASFWHSEPSDFLLGHRTTEDLPEHADVVIVGSGITGASAARYLYEDERAKDLKVVMLEAREACWGATGRNGGHCQPLLLDSPPDVVDFEVKNFEAIQDYIEEHSVACEWKVRNSCRAVWTDKFAQIFRKELAELQATAPHLASRAKIIEDPKVLSEEFKLKESPLALIVTTVAQLWPYKLITHILTRCIKSSYLNLQTKTPMTSISQPKDSSEVVVNTPRGTIKARHIILATNGYTAHLLPEFRDLIVPERGVMSALLPPPNSDLLKHTYGFTGNGGRGHLQHDYLIQRSEGDRHLMFGGGKAASLTDYVNTVDDSVLDEGSARYLRKELLKILSWDGKDEGQEELEAVCQWSGIWGTSRDSLPWVGEVPGRTGVWIAGGYSGHGMPNGTLCGKAIVEMVLGRESGAPVDYIEERLVTKEEIPRGYLVSEERIEKCRELPSVKEQVEIDAGGFRERRRQVDD